MNRELKSSGINAIGGLSMSGGAAVDLAIQAPRLYEAVGTKRHGRLDRTIPNSICSRPPYPASASYWSPLGESEGTCRMGTRKLPIRLVDRRGADGVPASGSARR